jgi:hypothetical protein
MPSEMSAYTRWQHNSTKGADIATFDLTSLLTVVIAIGPAEATPSFYSVTHPFNPVDAGRLVCALSGSRVGNALVRGASAT